MTQYTSVDELLARTGMSRDIADVVIAHGLTDQLVRDSKLSPEQIGDLFAIFDYNGGRSKEARRVRLVMDAFLDGRLPGALITERHAILLQFDVTALATAVEDLASAGNDAEGATALTPAEAAYLNADSAALLEILTVVLSGTRRVVRERLAPVLRSVRIHGRDATAEYGAALLSLDVDGQPLGPGGAQYVLDCEELLRERMRREGGNVTGFGAPWTVNTPSGGSGAVFMEHLGQLHREGLGPQAAIDRLAGASFDSARAVGAVRNRIAAAMSDGWL